jgi:hypothetical protein
MLVRSRGIPNNYKVKAIAEVVEEVAEPLRQHIESKGAHMNFLMQFQTTETKMKADLHNRTKNIL